MRGVLAILAMVLIGCGSEPVHKAETTPVPPKIKDDTAKLLQANLIASEIVPDHILKNSALPGGTLGHYKAGGKEYQMFIIETATAQDAAILLIDMQHTLKDAEYIAYMGGYFGTDANGPVYVFAKKQYLAGIAGLPKAKADPIARELAARLN
jgi:hypothetical protein